MKRTILLASMMFTVSLSGATFAAAKSKVEQTLQQKILENFPTLKDVTIEKSEVANFYQVSSGPVVFFISKDGKYLFSGDLIDLDHQQFNITENVKKKALVTSLKNFGESNMVVFAPKEAKDIKHTITVFTDIDCGYCQKFHSEIDKYNQLGFKVRYMAFPRAGEKSESFDTAVKVWCAADKQAAMTKAKRGEKIEGPLCQTKTVADSFALGGLAGIRGTPAIVFEDGTIVPGYLPPDRLLITADEIAKHAKKMDTIVVRNNVKP